MPEADLSFENRGTLTLVRPVSDAGRDWLDENVQSEGWQWIGGALAVEPRYVGELVCGADCDGLLCVGAF